MRLQGLNLSSTQESASHHGSALLQPDINAVQWVSGCKLALIFIAPTAPCIQVVFIEAYFSRTWGNGISADSLANNRGLGCLQGLQGHSHVAQWLLEPIEYLRIGTINENQWTSSINNLQYQGMLPQIHSQNINCLEGPSRGLLVFLIKRRIQPSCVEWNLLDLKRHLRLKLQELQKERKTDLPLGVLQAH